MSAYDGYEHAEVEYGQELQSQTLHTVFAALGGMQMTGQEGRPTTVMDDCSSVRRTLTHMEDGKRYRYTVNVTVKVSRVEIS